MLASGETIVLEGFRELQQAFKLAEGELQPKLRKKLREVVEPIRSDAQDLAFEQIPHIGIPWSEMRIGVTATSVYLAPRQRGTNFQPRKRPNLAGLLLGRSMMPALEQHEADVVDGIEDLLGEIASDWARV